MKLLGAIKGFFQKRAEKKARQMALKILQTQISPQKKEFYLALHSKVGALAAKKQLKQFDPLLADKKKFVPHI